MPWLYQSGGTHRGLLPHSLSPWGKYLKSSCRQIIHFFVVFFLAGGVNLTEIPKQSKGGICNLGTCRKLKGNIVRKQKKSCQ